MPGPGSASTRVASPRVVEQPVDRAAAELLGRGDQHRRAGVDVGGVERVRVADHGDVDALVLEHPRERLGAVGRGVVGVQAPRPLGAAVGRARRPRPRPAARPRPASVDAVPPHGRHPERVVERQHAGRLLAGGRPVAVQHLVEERRRPVHAGRGPRGAARRGRRRPRGRWRPGRSSSRPRSTWRTASARKPSTTASACRPSASACSARRRSSAAVTTSSVLTTARSARRPCGRRAPGTAARRVPEPAAGRPPSRRRSTAAVRRSRRRWCR